MSKYSIVVDSSCELPEKWKQDPRFHFIPFGLQVDDWHVMDDASFDQAEFIKRVAAFEGVAKSACPSPDGFREAFDTGADEIYAITISSKLSGCFNSASLGLQLYREKHPEKKIHIFDSESTAGAEGILAMKIIELADSGMAFDDVVTEVTKLRDEMTTYFILDNLETLRKNGRLSGVKALVASTLNIKPIMAGKKGEIVQLGQAIGMKKALMRLADHAAKEIVNPAEKTLIISHCNCPERAETTLRYIQERVTIKDAIILDTHGLNSLYANDGGIIVSA